MLSKLKNFWHKLVGMYLIGASTTFAFLGGTSVFAQGTPWGNNTLPFQEDQNTDGINVGGAGNTQGDSIIDIVKQFINYALGLLGLIALIMLLWGGYKMVTSGGQEDAYKEGLKILKNAAIGIAFIAVSWFLVQFIFRVLGLITS